MPVYFYMWTVDETQDSPCIWSFSCSLMLDFVFNLHCSSICVKLLTIKKTKQKNNKNKTTVLLLFYCMFRLFSNAFQPV